MWLPQQTRADWRENVEALIEVAPDHASLYLLELYPNAPLKEDMARAGWSLAPDDDAAEMYLWSLERLEGAGYRQYEISNVARPGLESRHNLKYWQDGEWLGFGCGAHSTARRRAVEERLLDGGLHASHRRSDRRGRRRTPRLDPRNALEEALFTGSAADGRARPRAASGARYEIGRMGDAMARRCSRSSMPGWSCTSGPVRLSRDGMLLANEILAVFV